MSQPAARITDPLLLLGVVSQGFPNVLIGGLPAARAYDFVACAGLHPPTFIIPHLGVIVGPCARAVLIGGKPAALQFDFAICIPGGGNMVITGFPTVLMGEASLGQMMSRLWDDFNPIPPDLTWENFWNVYFPMLINPFGPLIVAISRGKFSEALYQKSVLAYNTNLVVHLNTVVANYIAGVNVVAGALVAAAVAFVVWPLVSVEGGAPSPEDRFTDFPVCVNDPVASPLDGAQEYAPVYFL